LALGCGQNHSAPAVPTAPPAPTPPPSPPPSTAPAVTTKDWRPDAALLDQLEPYQDVEGYEIRLPKGFELAGPPETPLPGISGRTWKGPARSDGSRPSFLLKLITPPPEAAASLSAATLEDGLQGVLPPNEVRGPDYQQESAESGQINGIAFARVGFRFTWAGTQGKVQGAAYSGKQGGTFIGIRIHDYEPYHEESLKLLNAAVMTLRKK
jgi:hypothetical protein